MALTARLKGTYLITAHDRHDDRKLRQDVTEALAGGATVLQYRDKTTDTAKRRRQAALLRDLTAKFGCLLIINDDIELARHVLADGVHLGKSDNQIHRARDSLGPEAIIGASCYNQLERAFLASEHGADYIAFGRFFPSTSKPEAVQAHPDLLTQARQELHLPIVAIGGITHDNASQLIDAGADMIAVINAVFGQPNIQAATRQFQNLFLQQG